MGAPKLTEELIDRITEILEEGNYDKVAAQAVGISTGSFYRWMREGKKLPPESDSLYRKFYDAIERAKAKGEVRLLRVIKTASSRSWQAAAWILERSRPQRWALRKSSEDPVSYWKKEILHMLKEGVATPQYVENAIGPELARELFEQAGIAISGIGEAEKAGGSKEPNAVS